MSETGTFHPLTEAPARWREATAGWWRGPEFLVTLFWLVALSGTIAFGATGGNLSLSGAVPLVLDITMAPTPASSNLDLSATQPVLTVADIAITSNHAAGYRVAVRSNNATNGSCQSPCFYSPTTTNSLTFSLYRNGTPIGFTGDTGMFALTTFPSQLGGDLYAAGVSYDGAAALLGSASNYGEVLLFTASIN